MSSKKAKAAASSLVPIQIQEAVGHASSKFDKKKVKDLWPVPRTCHAVRIAGGAWMNFSKKWIPIAFYTQDNQLVKVLKDDNPLELRLEIEWEVMGGINEKTFVDCKSPHGSFYYYFRTFEFASPGKYTVTLSCLNGEELGYDVTPLVIKVEVLEKVAESGSTSTSGAQSTSPKKKAPVAPPTPSSATNTRRATAISSSTKTTDSKMTDAPAKSTTSKDINADTDLPPASRLRTSAKSDKVLPPMSPKPKPRGRPPSTPKEENESSLKKKRKSDASVGVPEDVDAPAVTSSTDETDQQSHLDRHHIMSSLVSRDGNSSLSYLENMLSQVLLTALLDDAHDVHVRSVRRAQYQQHRTAKRAKKLSSAEETDVPPEVFISALPSLRTSDGLGWSVHTILHDPAYLDFMLKGAAPRNKKKLASQLTYNVNTFLVSFESLCHIAIEDPSASSSLSGSPLLYSEEVTSLQSSGLLSRIEKDNEEFLYHHCNARHLLRALVLILLLSPKYATTEKETSNVEPDEQHDSFFEFTEKTMEYLRINPFPLLYQQ